MKQYLDQQGVEYLWGKAKRSFANLSDNGKVPASQLPSYVDDVEEYGSLASFPEQGEAGKIYVTTDTNLQYRWSGSTYVEIGKSIGLGQTVGTAYPGDKGKYLADNLQTEIEKVKIIQDWINKGYQFRGIATPDTNPGTPNDPVFYFATEVGVYAHFNDIEIIQGEGAILLWSSGTWSKKISGFATQQKVTELESNLRYVSSIENGIIDIDDGIHINVSKNNNTVYSTIYYSVEGNSTYKINGLNGLAIVLYLYDIEKNFLGYYRNIYFKSHNTFTTQENVAYVRISLRNLSGTLTKETFSYNIWFEDYKLDTTDIFNSFQCGKLSIIGDSISTFDSEDTKIDGYNMHYPASDVDNVNKTYWGRLLNHTNGSLEVNASYSGSCVTNIRANLGYPSLCDRIPLIGNPDTIIIALGTNDSNDKAQIGSYLFNASIDELDESKFAQAYIKGIKMIQSAHPTARIVCVMFTMDDSYRSAIKSICSYYGLMSIEIPTYQSVGDNKHPSLNGMVEIANRFTNIFNKNYVEKNFQKYGSLLTDITFSYISGFDTFVINKDEDTITINDNIYLYPIGKTRIVLTSSNYSPAIKIGLEDKITGTKFLVYDSINDTIKTVSPYETAQNEDGIYVFAIIQKFYYRVGVNFLYKYEIHTKNNAHKVMNSDFDGVYSTSTGHGYFSIDDIKSPGIYIRKDAEKSRGGILYVSVTNEVISQAYTEINTSGKFVTFIRTFDNSTQAWSKFKNTEGAKYLNFPSISLNGDVVFDNNKITFKGTPYIYYLNKRSTLPLTGELTLTTALTRLVWDSNTKTITDMPINEFVNEEDIVTIGFIVRDSSGNIKSCLSNIASQKNIYPSTDGTYTKAYLPSKVKYIPHRGVRNTEIPENTTYSVMFAALYGLKYSECDVRYTSDGIGVVMHDTTINRTMYNTDLSSILESVTVADNTYEVLSRYIYRSTNEIYRTKLQTIQEYIDACAQWDICPIIQGKMSDEDLRYCMQRLGDNWICYDGNFTKVRTYSQNVLCLTSASYDSMDAMVTELKSIGGNVGLSRLYNNQLTNEYIAACKENKWEVMASYAYAKENIPDAIIRGATIILSDNIGKDTNKVLISSFSGWDSFTHNGTVENGKLRLAAGQWLNFKLNKKGSYKVYIQFSGEGSCVLPSYDNSGVLGETHFPMNNNIFLYTFLYLGDSYTMSIDATTDMIIERLIIFYEN